MKKEIKEEKLEPFEKEIRKAEKANGLNDYTMGLFMLGGRTTKQQRIANVIGYIEGLKKGKEIAYNKKRI